MIMCVVVTCYYFELILFATIDSQNEKQEKDILLCVCIYE